MNRFEMIQERLEELSPIPVNMPKLYLLGDTGAGKTTIVRRILGTDELKFPSVQQKRTTVAVTEYVLSKDLPYRATYLFKSEEQIGDLVDEILEISIENAYMHYEKSTLSIETVVEDLEETPDEKFRLRYILTVEHLEELAKEIIQFMPALDATVKTLSSDLQSNAEELGVVVDLAVDQHKETVTSVKIKILGYIEAKVSEVCDGHRLFSDADFFQHSSGDQTNFISKAKLLLSSAKNSISPVIDYARLQGNLLAEWLPSNTELVLIDGEGIGHDTKEASRLSARHLDYFHFADSIALVEECKKPFASGGKSAIEGIVRNGYSEKFHLVFTKLDEVEISDSDGSNRSNQIRAVKRGLVNVKNALKEDDADFEIGSERLYYLACMNTIAIDTDSVFEVHRLLTSLKAKFDEVKPQFVKPLYDYEMLSSYISKSSGKFTEKWNIMLDTKHWQTVKAFNRRMCWESDGFRDMEPIVDFHTEITKELEYFISHPMSWSESVTLTLQNKSISKLKQEFSKQLLAFARTIILKKCAPGWVRAMSLSGFESASVRKKQIQRILEIALPNHRNPEAVNIKDSIKQLLESAVVACET